MSYQRISASTKESIKKAYGSKIAKLNSNIEERGRELSENYINELNNSEAYKSFKASVLVFADWLEAVDPDDNYSAKYHLDRIKSYINDRNFFSRPYSSKLESLYGDKDGQIQKWLEEKSNLVKECNKLLWNLEMSPKSSKEYKDALVKAEEILFNGDANEE